MAALRLVHFLGLGEAKCNFYFISKTRVQSSMHKQDYIWLRIHSALPNGGGGEGETEVACPKHTQIGLVWFGVAWRGVQKQRRASVP